MFHKGISFTSVTALASLAFSSAFAQSSQRVEKEIAQPVGLVTALKVAQESAGGGVLDAELEMRDGQLVYEIDLVKDKKLREILVNAETGKLISTKDHPVTALWGRIFHDDKLRAAEAAHANLFQGLENAERDSGGKASELSLEREDGRWLYEVELDDAKSDRDIMIEPATGRIIASIDD